MEKFNLIVIVLIIIALNGWSQNDISKSKWKEKEIVIDGNDHEWTKPLRFYDQESGFMYAICNDNKNVYLDFSCNDEMKMRKILSAGWSVALSSKEKNKKFNTSITFTPMPKMSLGIKRSGSRGEQKVDVNLIVRTYLLEASMVIIKGFQSSQSSLRLNDQNQSAVRINIAVGADSTQNLVYEFAIPLKELLSENTFQPEELLTLSVEVNSLEMPTLSGGSTGAVDVRPVVGRSGSGRGGSGGGRGGSNVSRPGGSTPEGSSGEGGSGDRGNIFEKTTFKQKFTLVKN